MTKPLLQILLLLALVLLGIYYWASLGSGAAEALARARLEALPKTYLVNSRSSVYDEDGALSEVMEASRAELFPQRRESLLEAPRFYSHDGNDRTWSASSRRGRFQHRREVLHMTEQVVMVTDHSGARLETEAMRVNLRRKNAVSTVPVTITQGENVIRADGMIAELDKERIIMKPNVESVYVQARP